MQNPAADPSTRPSRMDEKRADARRVRTWIKLGIIAICLVVAAEKRFPFAPAAAADEFDAVLNDKIGLIEDQLSIHPKGRTERRFHLRGGIIGGLQSAHGKRNQFFNCANVVFGGDPQFPIRLHKIDIYSVKNKKPSAL